MLCDAGLKHITINRVDTSYTTINNGSFHNVTQDLKFTIYDKSKSYPEGIKTL